MILTDKSISVILGVYNQGDVLGKTLQVWKKTCLRYKPGSELIICDDGSDDNTEDVVLEFMDQSAEDGLRIVYCRKERGPSAELSANINQALTEVRGKYVLVAMGDSYPFGEILDNYAEHLSPNVVLTGLRTTIDSAFQYNTMLPDYRASHPSYYNIDTSTEPWTGFTGNNFVCSSELFIRSEGWNEYFKGYGAEDWEWAAYVYYRFNTEFLPVPGARVFHIRHTERPGSGKSDYYLAQWFYKLAERYASGDFNRSTEGFSKGEGEI